MRKSISFGRVLLIVLGGAILGTIAGDLLGRMFHIPLLSSTTSVNWHPAGNFVFLKYDFFLEVKLNMTTLLGIGVAYWISKKL